MIALDLLPGMVLLKRTGPVRILKRSASHGGVELVVSPACAPPGARNTRTLWFWGTEVVTVQAGSERGGAPLGDDRVAGQVQP
jgi:hypothetical protein